MRGGHPPIRFGNSSRAKKTIVGSEAMARLAISTFCRAGLALQRQARRRCSEITTTLWASPPTEYTPEPWVLSAHYIVRALRMGLAKA